MFGHLPRVPPIESNAISSTQSEAARIAETFAIYELRASGALRKIDPDEKVNIKPFAVGSWVLLVHGTELQNNDKWPTFQSKVTGPYKVKQEMNPGYILESKTGRRSRRAVQARRIVQYHTPNSTTPTVQMPVKMIIMVRAPHLLDDYTSKVVQGDPISTWLLTTTSSRNE